MALTRTQAASTIQRSWRSSRSRLTAHPLSKHKTMTRSRSVSGLTQASALTQVSDQFKTFVPASRTRSSLRPMSKSARTFPGNTKQWSPVTKTGVSYGSPAPPRPVMIDIDAQAVKKKTSNNTLWISLAVGSVIFVALLVGGIMLYTRPEASDPTEDSKDESKEQVTLPATVGCRFCNWKGAKDKLGAHEKSCDKAKCRHCKKDFSQQANADSSTVSEHEKDECPERHKSKKFYCFWCNAEYNGLEINALNRHEIRCWTPKRECYYCWKRFWTRSDYFDHKCPYGKGLGDIKSDAAARKKRVDEARRLSLGL